VINSGNVWIQTGLDGFLGEIVSRSLPDASYQYILIRKASWVADTGRRSLFMAGKFDSNCEIEVYPPEQRKEIPVSSCMCITQWPHQLPEETK
jgi:hypothetical protein